MAHGAGAGMTHAFMSSIASDHAERGVATLRFQFPYMERGAKRPDPPKPAHATVRAAVAEASRRLPELSLFAGGRSFGGRMTSQAQAASPLPGVRGLVFLGFPLHRRDSLNERAVHLDDVRIPMLFLQGPATSSRNCGSSSPRRSTRRARNFSCSRGPTTRSRPGADGAQGFGGPRRNRECDGKVDRFTDAWRGSDGRSGTDGMTTELLFRADAYATTASARAIAVHERGIELDRTIFYPTGGGQAGDTGALLRANGERIAIVDTRKGRNRQRAAHRRRRDAARED
jgi:hypothetical protein